MLKLRKNKKGFTLVELIVVIAIMAVLAGVVAGVTVSQLNKQTDKTGQTQAKQIADFIANCALTQDTTDDADIKVLTVDSNGKTSFNEKLVNDLMTAQYGAASIPVATSGKGGTITVTTTADKVTVKYNPKASGGVTYEVSTAGIVTKVNPTASSEPEPETPQDKG